MELTFYTGNNTLKNMYAYIPFEIEPQANIMKYDFQDIMFAPENNIMRSPNDDYVWIVAHKGDVAIGVLCFQIQYPHKMHYVSVHPKFQNEKVATSLVYTLFFICDLLHINFIEITPYTQEGLVYLKRILYRMRIFFPSVNFAEYC